MSGRLEFTTANTFDSVAEGARRLAPFAEENSLPPRKAYQLELIYEELMTNVVKYSYPDSLPHQIHVILDHHDDELAFTIIHDGSDFDPWTQEDPDLTTPLEDRQEGGIGILLCRKFSRSTSYERKDGKSIITVVI
ncbi:MAG: ATP-binding protein [Lentisphaeria bacterium]|nr:ATP-binding protein [Lentisphaeria bacterium]